jgi:hypothetical protein
MRGVTPLSRWEDPTSVEAAYNIVEVRREDFTQTL